MSKPLTDFIDLWDYSCLNGWTMGNIATTASEISRFYYALANGQLITKASLAQMLDFVPLTNGTQVRTRAVKLLLPVLF